MSCPLYPTKRTFAVQTPMSAARLYLSALALHRFVREPLELDRKWMRKAHLTLRHYQACGILVKRNPPLGACTSAPKELASRVLMIEHRRPQYQRSREPGPPPLRPSETTKSPPPPLRQLVGHHQLNSALLQQGRPPWKQASTKPHHARHRRDHPATAVPPREGT